jgi:hypothetical protein
LDELNEEKNNQKRKSIILPTLKDFDLIKVLGTGGFS